MNEPRNLRFTHLVFFAQGERHVFADAHVREEADALEHVTDAPTETVRFEGGGVVA